MRLEPVPAPVPLGVLELPLAAGKPAMISAWVSPPAEGGVRLSAPIRAHDDAGALVERDTAVDRLLGYLVAQPPGVLSPEGMEALIATSGFAHVREGGWPDRLFLTASLVVFAYADASETMAAAGHAEGSVMSAVSAEGRRLASAVMRLGRDGASPDAPLLARDAARIGAAISATTESYAPALFI
ncbi:MAG: hypothetical protein AAF577_09870 [Pseudomonadota bacterium]